MASYLYLSHHWPSLWHFTWVHETHYLKQSWPKLDPRYTHIHGIESDICEKQEIYFPGLNELTKMYLTHSSFHNDGYYDNGKPCCALNTGDTLGLTHWPLHIMQVIIKTIFSGISLWLYNQKNMLNYIIFSWFYYASHCFLPHLWLSYEMSIIHS